MSIDCFAPKGMSTDIFVLNLSVIDVIDTVAGYEACPSIYADIHSRYGLVRPGGMGVLLVTVRMPQMDRCQVNSETLPARALLLKLRLVWAQEPRCTRPLERNIVKCSFACSASC